MSQRKAIFIMIAVILFFACIFAYFFIESVSLDNALNELHDKKENQIKTVIMEEKVRLGKDYNEKYKEAMSSFETLFKNLQAELKKSRQN